MIVACSLGLLFDLLLRICIVALINVLIIVPHWLEYFCRLRSAYLSNISTLPITRFWRISRLKLRYGRNLKDWGHGRYLITGLPETSSVCEWNHTQQRIYVRDKVHVITDGRSTRRRRFCMLQIAMYKDSTVFRDGNELNFHERTHYPRRLYGSMEILMGPLVIHNWQASAPVTIMKHPIRLAPSGERHYKHNVWEALTLWQGNEHCM